MVREGLQFCRGVRENSGDKYPIAYHLHGWTGNESSELTPMEKVYRNRRAITVFPNSSPVIIDFVLTSPPYMQKTNHPEYPFAGYRITGQGYEDYLNDIECIFKQLSLKLMLNAYVVIEVSNLHIDGNFTPLAWDVAVKVGMGLSFQQEIIIDWQCDIVPAYGFGYDHSYTLVFQNTEGQL